MKDLGIITNQTPGSVTFDNYQEVKTQLQRYIQDKFTNIDYEKEGLAIAIENCDELKGLRDEVTTRQKTLKAGYSAPYITVEKMLDELVSIIDGPYKCAKQYVDSAEKKQKKEQILNYAMKKADELDKIGKRIIDSPAFFNDRWLLKGCKVKNYQDDIDKIFQQAAKDINTIQATAGDNTSILMAQYYETLSMNRVKSFLESLNESQEQTDSLAVESESNVLGYKILKITATQDQMASIMDQLDLMGVDVEELEDGMPKAMKELIKPDFYSFVAFDIETTGTYGAANRDGEAKIIEIGAVKIVDGEIVERFDELVNPERDIVPMVTRIHHITNEMVSDKPLVDEVIKKFHEFVGDNILVGHNIKSSDLRYITKAADKAGIHFSVPFLDTYLLAKKFKKQMKWENVKLPYLTKQYGFEHKEEHRAWSDAEVNAQVYFELQKLSLEN